MFCTDVSALTASKLTVVNRKTSQRIYECLRMRVVEMAIEEARPFTGEVEIDESYFGPGLVRGRRGRGAGRKTPVIGLHKRGRQSLHRSGEKLLSGRAGADYQETSALPNRRLDRRLARL